MPLVNTKNTPEVYAAALACANILDHNRQEGRDDENQETWDAFAHLEEVSGIPDFLEAHCTEISYILERDMGRNPRNHLSRVELDNLPPEARAIRMVDAVLRWRQKDAEATKAEQVGDIMENMIQRVAQHILNTSAKDGNDTSWTIDDIDAVVAVPGVRFQIARNIANSFYGMMSTVPEAYGGFDNLTDEQQAAVREIVKAKSV